MKGGENLTTKVCLLLAIVMSVTFVPFSALSVNGQAAVNSKEDVTNALEDMSIDELLILQNEIQELLADKGYVKYEELDRGSKGDAVLDVQERLKELGYYTGTLSGKFDSETQKAFKQFEKSNGLTTDGKASQNDLVFLFSSSANAKATPIPAEPTEKPSKKSDEIEMEGYLPFTEFDYTEYFRYPEKYFGSKIVLKGKAVQVLGSRSDGFQIRLATSGSSDIVYIWVRFDPGFNILEDDRLTICAEMRDTYSYISTWGNTVTIPSANADSIKLN